MSKFERLYVVGNYSELKHQIRASKPDKVGYMWKAKMELDLGEYKEYLKTIANLAKLEPNKKLAEIIYSKNKSIYFHHKLQIDSALFYANECMKLHQAYQGTTPKAVLCDLYLSFANVARNGDKSFFSRYKTKLGRDAFLLHFLDTANYYATTNLEKANLKTLKGLIYLDNLPNQKNNIKKAQQFFAKSNACFNEALHLVYSPFKQARIYALKGLICYYTKQYTLADKYYALTDSLIQANPNGQAIFLLVQTQAWRISNLLELYQQTHDLRSLVKAEQIGLKTEQIWKKYYQNQRDKTKGLQDGYWANTNQYLFKIYLELYARFKSMNHLNKAYYYGQKTKFLSLDEVPVSIREIQDKLKEKQCFVDFLSTHHNKENYIVFIGKKQVFLQRIQMSNYNFPNNLGLYAFEDVEKQQKSNIFYYSYYFSPVKNLLEKTQSKEVIISNSDLNPLLNFDVLQDPKSKQFPGLYYIFSYTLTARSWLTAKTNSKTVHSFGISTGIYKKQTNLLFSQKLRVFLKNKYGFQDFSVLENLKKNDISLLSVHGKASLHAGEGVLFESDHTTITSSDLEKIKLQNTLIILSACNSALSNQYNSEGPSNNFPKLLLKAGAKSVLATSWEIDDKANALIIEYFMHYLAQGLPKNQALLLAKKQYLAQCKSEEEKHPRYWAGYQLYGNIEAVTMEKPTTITWVYWLICGLPILAILLILRRKLR